MQQKGIERLLYGRFFSWPWGLAPSPTPWQRELERAPQRWEWRGQRPGGANDDRNRSEGWGGKGPAWSRGVQGDEEGEVRRDTCKRLRSEAVFGHLITPPVPQPLSSERVHQ